MPWCSVFGVSMLDSEVAIFTRPFSESIHILYCGWPWVLWIKWAIGQSAFVNNRYIVWIPASGGIKSSWINGLRTRIQNPDYGIPPPYWIIRFSWRRARRTSAPHHTHGGAIKGNWKWLFGRVRWYYLFDAIVVLFVCNRKQARQPHRSNSFHSPIRGLKIPRLQIPQRPVHASADLRQDLEAAAA